jgi:hypothetical protein
MNAMSAGTSRGSPQSIELNLTPILDCFTVLITFLLASAGFLSIGFFEAAVPGAGSNPDAPVKELKVRLRPPGIAEVSTPGKGTVEKRFDLDHPEEALALEAFLITAGKSASGRAAIVLSPADSAGFDLIAKTLGHLNRTRIPITLEETP